MKLRVKIRKGQKESMSVTSKSSAFPEKITKSGIRKQSRMKRERRKSKSVRECCASAQLPCML